MGAVGGAPSSPLRASDALCAWVGARDRAHAAPAAGGQQLLDPDHGAACCGSRGKPRAAAAGAYQRLGGARSCVGAAAVATAGPAPSHAQPQRARSCAHISESVSRIVGAFALAFCYKSSNACALAACV